MSEHNLESISFSKYKLIKQIGRGAFGEVFLAHDIENNDEYAVKIESK